MKPVPPAPPFSPAWLAAMEAALEQARAAASRNEAPIGAVVLSPDNAVISQGSNSPIDLNDPTAHAEILALRRAGDVLGNYRLPGCTLVVTLEPCLMCVGAAIHARVAGIVYGATDPKAGAVASQLNGAELPFVNHRFWSVGGILEDESRELLQTFFREKRGKT